MIDALTTCLIQGIMFGIGGTCIVFVLCEVVAGLWNETPHRVTAQVPEEKAAPEPEIPVELPVRSKPVMNSSRPERPVTANAGPILKTEKLPSYLLDR